MPPAAPKTIQGYAPGPLPITGAVTVEIITPPVPLQPFIDAQYIDSKTMSRRPGMYMKYLPYLYAPMTGKLLTGGCYAFDTFENAKDYARWTSEDFMVAGQDGEKKVKFWDQPMFESHRSWVWKVLGAHAFAPLEEHVCMRLVQWRYEGGDAEEVLGEAFPKIRDSVERMDGAAVWLLHNTEEKMVGLQIAFRGGSVGGEVDEYFAEDALAGASGRKLEHLLPDWIGLKYFFDRTSLVLTMWLPKSRAKGGKELHIPLLPKVVPDITHEYM